MAKVITGITMSLDGYVTGPNDRLGAGLGEGGERLHHWVFGGPWTYDTPRGSPVGVDRDYLDDVFASGGAWIVGRTMYDVVDGWGDDPGFGIPVFVVTHRSRETVVKGDTTFEFVTGGIVDALARAQTAAAGNVRAHHSHRVAVRDPLAVPRPSRRLVGRRRALGGRGPPSAVAPYVLVR